MQKYTDEQLLECADILTSICDYVYNDWEDFPSQINLGPNVCQRMNEIYTDIKENK